MKGEPGSLQSKLSKFLFNYRNTPHPSTGKPPAVMLIGRLLRSHLDLLRPEKKTNVGEPIPAQFAEKQSVMVRDYRPGQKWQPGVIERRIGSYLYLVRTGDVLLKRNVDQILPLKTIRREPAAKNSEKPSPPTNIPLVSIQETVGGENSSAAVAEVPDIVPTNRTEVPAVEQHPEGTQQLPSPLPARRTSSRHAKLPDKLNDFVLPQFLAKKGGLLCIRA